MWYEIEKMILITQLNRDHYFIIHWNASSKKLTTDTLKIIVKCIKEPNNTLIGTPWIQSLSTNIMLRLDIILNTQQYNIVIVLTKIVNIQN